MIALPLRIESSRAQTTVSTGPGYADEVFFNLVDGHSHTEPRADWDIAFQIDGFASSIITNGGAGSNSI